MSNVVLCILALVTVLGTVASQTVEFNCQDVVIPERVPCGAPGISWDQCRALRCCYDTVNPNSPPCYTKLMRQPVSVVIHPPPPPEKSVVEQMRELCQKCDEQRGRGILGVASSLLFGSRLPKECDACHDNRGILKRENDKRALTV